MLKQFFEGLSEGIRNIVFCFNSDGRPTGEAYVELASENDFEIAMSKDKESIGKRYIELFRSKKEEMDLMDRHNNQSKSRKGFSGAHDCIVRLRGLPYGCWEEDLANFFAGLNLAPNGIILVTDRNDKQTGEAFVQFSDVTSFEAALKKNKEHIGHRYVEVFPSSYDEYTERMHKANYTTFEFGERRRGGGADSGGRYSSRSAIDRFDRSSYGGGRSGGYMGGYGGSERFSPYGSAGNGGLGAARRSAGSFDSYSPVGGFRSSGGGDSASAYPSYYGGGGDLNKSGGGYDMAGRAAGKASGEGGRDAAKHVVLMRGLPYKAGQEDIVQFFLPLRLSGVQFTFNDAGRPSGEAKVEFFSHEDAVDAMKRDHMTMGERYIELYLKSAPSASSYAADSYQSFSSDSFGVTGPSRLF